mmetsp:Transcript_56994/g.177242  ORF Transcript_56994/g.177242 Transcript_56994/m.177242 type:complete len:287 (-) Transcript_56994:49-909(-)
MGASCSRTSDRELEELPLQLQVQHVLSVGRARGLAPPPREGRGPAPVRLNVYGAQEAGPRRPLGHPPAHGADAEFHCGVEVHDCEWSYGGEQRQWGFDWHIGAKMHPTGITCSVPRDSPGHVYSGSMPLGKTHLSGDEVVGAIQQIGRSWPAVEYDPVTRSCLDFSDTLCQLLGVGGVPDEARRLAAALRGGAAAGWALACCSGPSLCTCPAAAAHDRHGKAQEIDVLRQQLEQATLELRHAQRELACERASHDDAIRQVLQLKRAGAEGPPHDRGHKAALEDAAT